jgi:DNA polymerase III alpha subunit (gram-positive type)
MLRGMREIYCCVDIEASGPVPHLYDIVSLGAVAVMRGADGRHVVVEKNPFYVEFLPQGGAEDEGATRIHGLTRDYLAKNGVPLAEGLERLNAWARALHGESGGKLVFVGHNAVFDWAFVNYAYHSSGVESPWGWKALDTKSLAAGVLSLPFLDTNKERLAELIPGLGDQDAALVHRADYDALYQARILVALLDHRRS